MSEALKITKTEGGFVTAQAAEIVSDFLRLIHSYILLPLTKWRFNAIIHNVNKTLTFKKLYG